MSNFKGLFPSCVLACATTLVVFFKDDIIPSTIETDSALQSTEEKTPDAVEEQTEEDTVVVEKKHEVESNIAVNTEVTQEITKQKSEKPASLYSVTKN